jgi:hypothetical protein
MNLAFQRILEIQREFSIVVGFLAAISSFLVVLTPILFKRLRSLLFLRIISIISFCDTVTALSFILNIDRPIEDLSNNTLCQVQGLLITFFSNASIFWTAALTIQLYTIVKYSKPYYSELSMHLVFWSIPIFFEIVPLFSGSTFGMDDLYPEFAATNCSLRLGLITDSKLATMLVTLQLFKFIAIGIIGVMSIIQSSRSTKARRIQYSLK